MEGISKRFPGTLALDHVDLALHPGEIHALVGQNGAGKSTLMKILAGDYHASSGTIRIEGRPVSIQATRDAQQLGIGIVYQELSLLPNLTVAENVALGHEPLQGIGLDRARMERLAVDALALLDVTHIDPRTQIARLSLPERHLVEIARVLAQQPRMLILDEPTAALAQAEAGRLFAILRRLRDRGIGIIYISHRFKEILTVCDRGTVLRNGRVAATFVSATTTLETLVELTLGQKPAAFYQRGAHRADAAEPVLAVRDLSVGARVRDVSFDVKRGEIVGLCGLLGSGQQEVARSLFGDQPGARGALRLRGRPVVVGSPRQARGLGIGFLTESRREEGLIPDMPVRENISIAALASLTWARLVPLLRRRTEQAAVTGIARRTGVEAAALPRPMRLLSGGNQQKALLARWLLHDADLFIFLEPTRGVDIGARAEIYRQLADLTALGKAVLLVSTDIAEVLALSDRILVMHEGRLGAVIAGAGATEEQVALAMQGGHDHAG
jgi:ABC-type sugar transport system ATPase subunit